MLMSRTTADLLRPAMKTPRLTVRVPQPLIAATRRLAMTSGQTNSDIVREALVAHLATCLAEDAGSPVAA